MNLKGILAGSISLPPRRAAQFAAGFADALPAPRKYQPSPKRFGAGKGPCARKATLGDKGRRVVHLACDPKSVTRHVTKGRVHRERKPAEAAPWWMSIPAGPKRAPVNIERFLRNMPKASVPGSIRRAAAALSLA